MKKDLKLIIFSAIVMIIALSFFNISSATDENTWILPEKSKEFEKWENLSEEERANVIVPSYSNISFKESIKKSRYNMLCSKVGDSLASNYRINGLTVKNQQATGLCWAFSFSSMLEGSGSRNVYSPAYLDYIASSNYNKNQGDGANSVIALGTATSGKYPVLETDMPFESVYDESKNSGMTYYLTPIDKLPEGTLNEAVDARITDATYFANIYKEPDSNGNITYTDGNKNEYTTNEVKAIRDLIKEHIQNDGPVNATMYSDLAMDADGNALSEEGYCNINTWASFCNDATKSTNHAITIVGWDDNYAVSNFNEDVRPINPGAYIVLNSYGEDVGNNGYIYISYEDTFIEQSMIGIDNLEEYESEEDIAYDNIYQYDELGYTYPIAFKTENVMAANVFSRKSSEIEYLNEVGIFLPITEGVEVYINATDDDKTKLTQVAVNTENITPGYHVIKLASPVRLTGNKFVVAVKYINKENGPYVPLEANWKDSGISYFSNYFDTATSNEGESFLSTDEGNIWTDINNLKVGVTVTLKNTNACIKAYTTQTPSAQETIKVTGINLNKTTSTVKVGATDTLTATVLPTNATNQNITWTTSDKNIATVSNGVITGIAKGTVTITATTEDGNYTASCEVEVKEEVASTVKVTGISLNKTNSTIKVGATDTLTATVLPTNATNQNVTWTTSDKNIATVSNGVITGIAKGTATITATTEDGNHTADCEVTVSEETSEIVLVTGVTLNKENLSLEVGDTSNLVATINPTDATNKNVTWTSSDESVATISDSGIITAISKGTTNITVTTVDGNFSATCKLTVTEKTNTDDDIYKDNIPGTDDSTNIKTDNIKDYTTANKVLPFTGNTIAILISIALLGAIMLVIFIKLRSLKDVK